MKALAALPGLGAGALLLLAASAAPAARRDGSGGAPPPVAPAQERELPRVGPQENDLHEEMFALVREIERTLERIDGDLNDASAGDVPLEAVEDSGLKGLLESTRREMQTVVEGIDHIFEIRDHHQSGGT